MNLRCVSFRGYRLLIRSYYRTFLQIYHETQQRSAKQRTGPQAQHPAPHLGQACHQFRPTCSWRRQSPKIGWAFQCHFIRSNLVSKIPSYLEHLSNSILRFQYKCERSKNEILLINPISYHLNHRCFNRSVHILPQDQQIHQVGSSPATAFFRIAHLLLKG